VSVNKERVALLVAALRSGRFAQGRGALKRLNRYCCLGVACVVAAENGLQLRAENFVNAVKFGDPDDFVADASWSLLPNTVRAWYGFVLDDPILTGEDGRNKGAAVWNDDYARDFAWIADAFERTFLAPDDVS
jgi:hypothetical protein